MMKKFIVLFVVSLFCTSCTKSLEERADVLIKAELNKVLYKPETYKPIETKVDSAFSPYDNPVLFQEMADLAKMTSELESLESDVKHAKSSMAIWTGPYMDAYAKNQYQEAKSDYEDATEQIEKLKEKGRDKYNKVATLLSQESKFIGFLAYHNYRADNNAGNTLIGNSVFLIDPQFEKVLFSCEVEEYNNIQEGIKSFKEQLSETY